MRTLGSVRGPRHEPSDEQDKAHVNSLVLVPSEVVNSQQGVLLGARARYAYDQHGVRDGQSIKVGVVGGPRGFGIVSQASPERVVIELSLSSAHLPPVPITLIVGVSRPQTIKKVIQAAVMFGVNALHFARSELGEKSYLQSRSLDRDQMEEESLKALEQVWDSRTPEISIHRSFDYLIDHVVPTIAEGSSEQVIKLLAHPTGMPLRVGDAKEIKGAHTLVAIGPERGWSVGEVTRFSEIGFKATSLGERVVRVEHALVFMLGKLALLRDDEERC
jgi:RsmE family RNA methyltransferase